MASASTSKSKSKVQPSSTPSTSKPKSTSSNANADNIDPRRLVGIHAERVTDVSSRDFPGHYSASGKEEYAWDLGKWRESLQVTIHRLSQHSVDFDIVGVDASIANAFRRIMIAEVPTIAIEQVFMFDNDSVIVDEVLAHRIGLVPLNVNPRTIDFRGPDDPPTDRNTIVFRIDITCTRNPSAPKPPPNAPADTPLPPPSELYINHELLSSHLTWMPAGEQVDVFAEKPPGPTNPNIVLAKLRPGQSVVVEVHAVKGVGKDHAKFSPVATASYRLLPNIRILKPIPPHLATKFQSCFSPGVINVDPDTKEVSVDPIGVRNDSVSREVLRHPEFEGYVQLGRVRDWYMFNVESESAYTPERLLPEAIDVMRTKLDVIKKAAEALRDRNIGAPAADGEVEDIEMADS